MHDRRGLAIVVSRVRWAAVALSLGLTFAAGPSPLSAAVALTAALALVNLPAAWAGRLPRRLVEPVLAAGLVADFAACFAWLLLRAADPYLSTMVVFILVAIEAAVLYQWAGAALFLPALLAALSSRLWAGLGTFGSSFPLTPDLFFSSIVILVAAASATIAAEMSRLRAAARSATAALIDEHQALGQETAGRERAEEARQASDERLKAIVRNAPVMLFLVDRQGLITFSEGVGLTALGRKPGEAVGWSVRELYGRDPGILDTIRQALSGTTVHTTVEEGGHAFAVSYAPFRDSGGAIVGAIGVAVDITERARAQAALQEQTELNAAMLRAQSDLGDLVVVSEGEKPVYVNPAFTAITGYTRDELEGIQAYELVAPVGQTDQAQARTPREGEPNRFERSLLCKDGRKLELELAQIAWTMNGRTRVFTIGRDVTERKRMEAELHRRLEELRRTDRARQALLHRLVKAQEEERQRIASDIHDDSIQAMTAVGIRLQILKSQLNAADHLKLLSQLQDTVDATTGRLRNLLFDLRPPALDQDGLAAALRQYLREMKAGAALTFQLENQLVAEPAPDARVILYRIAQEVLMNVRKHARASHVQLSLGEREAGVLVSIRDDGRGFAVDRALETQPGHLGLAAIRERAETAGGWLRIYSAPGEGTQVDFWIPASAVSATEAA